MTLHELHQCEAISLKICWYRAQLDPIKSACWMDEWALGYISAARDLKMINPEQAEFLYDVFQPVLDKEFLG